MPLLGNFAAQSNRKKKGSACVSGVLPVQVGQHGLFVHLFKHLLLVLRSTTICDRRFVRSTTTHRTTTDWASSGWCIKRHCACSLEVFARSNEKKYEAWDHLLMSPDVVSLVFTDQNWWNKCIEVSEERGPWACQGTVLFLELNLQAAAGKKF